MKTKSTNKTLASNKNNSFGLKETLMLFFGLLICTVFYSAYTNLEDFKKDCGNPFNKECSLNLMWSSMAMIKNAPLAFGFNFQASETALKEQLNEK